MFKQKQTAAGEKRSASPFWGLRGLSASASSAIAMAIYGGAGAQSVDTAVDDEVDTIVVSARKRDEVLSDIPVAVSVFGSDRIERDNITNLEEITARTPGVQFTEQATLIPGRAATAVRFRGMDTNQPVPSQQVGTVFLDGIYVATGVQSLDLSSLERVEIIKGPQSATFGRNTFGGAINYVTANPSFEFGGRVQASVADYGTYDVSASVEGPVIGDVLAFRASLRGFGTDGQYQSATDGGRLGQEQTRSGNLVLYAVPTENWTARFRVFYSEDRDGPHDGVFLGSDLSNFGNGPALANCNDLDPSRTATDYFCGNIADIVSEAGFSWAQLATQTTALTPETIAILTADAVTGTLTGNTVPLITDTPSLEGQGLARDQLRLQFGTDYVFDGGFLDGHTLSFLTGYSRIEQNWILDFDNTAATAWLDRDPKFDEDWTVEGRLTSPADQRFRYSIGVSYLDAVHEESGATGVLLFDWQGDLNAFGSGGPIIFYDQPPLQEGSQAFGVFGSLGYDITDQLTLDFEWRYQEDEISQGDDFSATFSNFLPRATLSYAPVEDTLLWATYSKGNLPGFFNASIPALTPDELDQVRALVGDVGTFNDEEELKNYEIGWRQALFDGRVNFSAVGYYMEWTNQKTRVGVPIIDEVSGEPRVLTLQVNAGNSELWGLEFEGDYRITDKLTGLFSVNYAGAEYEEFTCSFSSFVEGSVNGRVDCAGNRPPKFPKWSGSFTSRWTDKLVGDWDYYGQITGAYFGEAFVEEANFATFGDYWRFAGRIGVERDGLRLELWATNLFGNDDPESASRISDFSTSSFLGFANNFGVIATPPERRTFGARVVASF